MNRLHGRLAMAAAVLLVCTSFAAAQGTVTATLSVAGPQLKLTWVPLTTVAVNVPGADGGCVSSPGVVATAILEYGLELPAASVARIR